MTASHILYKIARCDLVAFAAMALFCACLHAIEQPRELSLDGDDWRIHEDTDGRGAERGMPMADLTQPGWIPAAVPGNIQADLEAAHQLKPLWYGAGDPRMAEVAQKYWWYRKDFLVPESLKGQRLTLVFDGVDHECEVWLNGKKIGANAGMFRRFWFDVSSAVLPGKNNLLAVKISRIPEELVHPLLAADGNMSGLGQDFFGYGQHKMLNCLKELKSCTNWGFDWGVNVWTLGIWRNVYQRATGPARIDWLQVQSVLSDNYRRAKVDFHLEIDSFEALTARAEVRIIGHGINLTKIVDAPLIPGINSVHTEIVLENPALWWPNGQGSQPLYQVEARLKRIDDDLLDVKTDRIGIREIRWGQVEGAPADFINPYRLMVNGRTIRMMGSNLIPPDLLFGRMNQRGRRFIELAHAAGINTFRLWGGGVSLSKEMYDLADECGILISNEFPLSYMPYPATDPTFLGNLDQTIRNIVKQLRNHPSIIEWSGGNEMQWKQGQQHPVLLTLEKAAKAEDQRIFRATCSMQGSRHSPWDYVPRNHNGLYDNPDLRDNNGEWPMMRYGEFGCQGPANLEVWQREIPPAAQWPLDINNPILGRKNVFHALMNESYWLRKDIIDLFFGHADNLESMIEGGQFLAAEGLRYAMDALRRRGKRLGGFTSWDYNEPWPNGAGSYMVDYDGRTLMNYDFVRQALVPVGLSLKYDSLFYKQDADVKAELFLTSDAPQRVENICWSWKARDRRGTVFADGKGTASIEPIEVKSLDAIELMPPKKTAFGPVFVELRLEDSAGKLLAERIHVFGLDGVAAPLAGLLKNREEDSDDDVKTPAWHPVRRSALEVKSLPARVEGDREVLELIVKNAGAMTALFCEPHPLIEYRTDLFIDNNHCFIPPSESRTITIRADREATAGLSLAQTGWRISCWNADDVTVEPSDDVLLAVGRRDAMCREFWGYFDPKKIEGIEPASLNGCRPDAAKLPYLLDGGKSARFEFPLSDAQAKRPARLRIHAADQSQEHEAVVEVIVNGTSFEQTLPKGLGIQKTDPSHLAFPATLILSVPENVLRQGNNTLEVRVKNGGWFTWDSLDCMIDN